MQSAELLACPCLRHTNDATLTRRSSLFLLSCDLSALSAAGCVAACQTCCRGVVQASREKGQPTTAAASQNASFKFAGSSDAQASAWVLPVAFIMDSSTQRMLFLGRQAPPVCIPCCCSMLAAFSEVTAAPTALFSCSSSGQDDAAALIQIDASSIRPCSIAMGIRLSGVAVQRHVDLRIEPGAYLAPSHAPISDVKCRVEVRLCHASELSKM